MRKNMFLLTLTLVLTLAAGSAWADAVVGLTTFTSGTPAIAASVNANFIEIQDSVDDNDTRITALQTTKTDYLYIIAAAFTPIADNSTFTGNSTGGTLIVNGPGTEFFVAPVHVPDGATITEFMINGIDNSAPYQWLGYLQWRPYNTTSGGGRWGGGTAGGAGAGYIEKTFTVNHTVDNSANKYFAYIYMNFNAAADMEMYGVRITYTYSP